MIAELSVENLAIIDRSQLRLERGFTVLTGETGAGKSLLIDAIELALGERADTEMVRAGARSASVSVAFEIGDSTPLQALCLELGVELDEGRLFVTREVVAEGGRSQCRIGGKLAPVSVLKRLGQSLVDLHGQHDHQTLLQPEQHLEYLDLWIGAPAQKALAEVAEAYSAYSLAQGRLDALRKGLREREQNIDLLRHQVNEIEQVGPKEGETEELQERVTRLQYAERLSEASRGALEAISEREGSALELIGTALKTLDEAARYDPALGALAAPLRDSLFQIEDAARSLGSYAEGLEADPNILDELQTRIETLKRLRRKYGDDEAEVLRFLEEARSRLSTLEDAGGSEESLSEAAQAALSRLQERAELMSRMRKSHGEQFIRLVEEQLGELALERAHFGVQFQPKPPSADGADLMEFLFTANPGEPLRPLSKVASGGEISRLMLAIKTVLAGKAGVPTLIFDEIDAGLGGRVGATLGRKLAELAQSYQVLAISHLPQVAAHASVHYRIEKSEVEGRVVTRVRKLTHDERLEEIARMLGGEHVTDTARAHARELVEGASGSIKPARTRGSA